MESTLEAHSAHRAPDLQDMGDSQFRLKIMLLAPFEKCSLTFGHLLPCSETPGGSSC